MPRRNRPPKKRRKYQQPEEYQEKPSKTKRSWKKKYHDQT